MSKNSKNKKSNQKTQIKYSNIVFNNQFENLRDIIPANINCITQKSSFIHLEQIKKIINSNYILEQIRELAVKIHDTHTCIVYEQIIQTIKKRERQIQQQMDKSKQLILEIQLTHIKNLKLQKYQIKLAIFTILIFTLGSIFMSNTSTQSSKAVISYNKRNETIMINYNLLNQFNFGGGLESVEKQQNQTKYNWKFIIIQGLISLITCLVLIIYFLGCCKYNGKIDQQISQIKQKNKFIENYV